MCCGGEMVIYLEMLEAAPRLFVFGAGLRRAADRRARGGCGFAVTVVDGREEWATPERFPDMDVRCREPDEAARELDLRRGATTRWS